METLVTSIAAVIVLFAACCVISLVAWICSWFPRVERAFGSLFEAVGVVFAMLFFGPMWLFMKGLDWAGNSPLRQAVVGVAGLVLPVALGFALAAIW